MPKSLPIKTRRKLLNRVLHQGIPVTQACQEFGVSRFTFYKWLKRHKSGKGLKDKPRRIKRFWRQATPEQEELVLKVVIENPDLSKYKITERLKEIAGRPVLSPHGVYNVLRRWNLTLPEARLAYAQKMAPVVRPATWFGQLRLIYPQVKEIGKAFLASFASSSVLALLFLLWLQMLSGQPIPTKFGLIFASISLSCGTFFFLYSMKYYLTLAVVLSFSRQPPEEGGGYTIGFNSRLNNNQKNGNGWLQRIFGLMNGNEREREREIAQTGGLQPSLDHIKLNRYPFVSIHLPLYNEKKVAERILKACTSSDYPNYEVIVVDDSTDKTTEIVQRYAKMHNRAHPNGPKIKVLHRPTRQGFKGGALAYALEHTNPKAEFVVVFDADFIPYQDTLELFIKYFKVNNNNSEDYTKNNVACVAGYQWHVLNKSENWITRGVRTEYAGSYVIERPGQEILGAVKLIHGSVYCIRADVLKKFGWGTSITEDFELTLKLYEAGYKVIYTPYVQAPAECASTLKRLIRQRMRWAEGHSHNIRKMFWGLLVGKQGPASHFTPSPLTLAEKLELLYLSPYYLQAFFFLIGTFSWLLAETVFRARLPFWTSLWGWSLVLTNLLSLPLVNAVGLFLEEAEEKDYLGILSFIFLSYLLVPFQAYASIKGFLEKEEGPWFRTPKTGKITDIFTRGKFYRWLTGIIPGRAKPSLAPITADISVDQRRFGVNQYVALATANQRFNSFLISRKKARWIGRTFLVILLIFSTILLSLAPTAPYFIKPKETQAKGFGMLVGPQNDVNSKSQVTNQKTELIEKRTQNSKTYFLGSTEDGRARYALDSSIGDIHYKDNEDNPNEEWKEIDTTILPSGGDYDFKNEANSFKSYFKKDSQSPNTVKYQEGESFITFTLEDNELGKLNKVTGYAQDNQFIYPKAYKDIDAKYSIYTTRLLEEFVLYQPREISKITQRVHFENAYFKEDDGAVIFYSNQTNQPVWEIPKPVMYELNEREKASFGIHYEIKKDGDDYLITKVIDEEGKKWLADESRIYPLVIDTTVDKQTAASGDDGGTDTKYGWSTIRTSDLLGNSGGIPPQAEGETFHRWIGVTYEGSVDVAYMEVYPEVGSGTPLLKVYGIDEDNPLAPTSAAEFAADPLTTAAVDWDTINGSGAWFTSPSLVSIFQELVDTYTISNEAVMVQIKNDPVQGAVYRRPRAWDYSGNLHGAKLHIEYTAADQVDTSTSANATAYSFQRKTWYDGTRLWSAFYSGTEIEFWYSADWGASWTQNTSATIAVSTSDFSIEADSSNAFITYTNGYDIEARSATTYPGTGFGWSAATVVYNGSSGTDDFNYPAISKDSNNKVWITATHLSGTDYIFKAIQSTTANSISAWGTASTLDTSTNSNKYGVIASLGSGNMYAVWIDGTAIEGKKYSRTTVDKQAAVSGDDGYTSLLGGFNNTAATLSIGCSLGFGPGSGRTFARWDGVTIEGTIDTSYIELYANSNGAGSPLMKVRGVDEDNPAAPTTEAEFDADPLTTNAVDWDGAFTADTWEQSGSLNTIFQELVDTYIISNEAVMVQVKDDGACSIFGDFHFNTPRSYDNTTEPANTWGPKLHIEYLAWDVSPTSIATGVTGLTNNMSAVSDSSGNVHLLYINSSDYAVYQEYTTSWQTAVTLDGTAGVDYPTISLNTSNNDLYALWIRSNVIYYKKGVSPYASGNWDASATSWKTTTAGTYLTSNYSGAGMIFATWTQGTGSPYSVMWDYIIIPEKLWLLLGLGLLIPKWLRKTRLRRRLRRARKNYVAKKDF